MSYNLSRILAVIIINQTGRFILRRMEGVGFSVEHLGAIKEERE